MDTDADYGLEFPGDGYDFEDVTELFVEAAKEMKSEDLLFMENFTLQDAMSALEIGEPRLDSGLIVQEETRPPFDPLTPLLPEEICWILDRALAYETQFHAGNFLPHTIHTFLYVHHIHDLDPEVASHLFASKHDPNRPMELITLVLKAAVQGLLKCCDMAWRELARGGTYDTEDWQSDKCDVSLLEGMPVDYALSQLEDAIEWVSSTPKVPIRWKVALNARLLLRKSLLQIMSTDPSKDRFHFQHLVMSVRDHLKLTETSPPIECAEDSPARQAFDPYIGRRLQTATPIRVDPPPSFADTCKIVGYFLDGLQEVGLLETIDVLSTWQIVGDLRQWLPDPPLRVPYVRSLTQTMFYSGFLVMNRHPFHWMANRFFYETIGVSYDWIKSTVVSRWKGNEEAPFTQLERQISKLITPHFRALWHNPPRRRRHFMKSLVDWHGLYNILVNIQANVTLVGLPEIHPLNHLSSVALLWRLPIIREVVLSGFQLELYASGERSFAYWYSAKVIETHLNLFDNILPSVKQGSSLHQEIIYQIHFLTALQSLCTVCALITVPSVTFDWDRARPNFFRRYKWAFREEYDLLEAPDVATPELHKFIRACGHLLMGKEIPTPTELVDFARSILLTLVNTHNTGGWAGLWATDRTQFIHNLISVCDNLRGLPDTADAMRTFDAKTLVWDPVIHPWFPSLKSHSSSCPESPH